MIIQENVGNVIIKVGGVSRNHVSLQNDNDIKAILIHINQWNEIKTKIDKMFKMVQECS